MSDIQQQLQQLAKALENGTISRRDYDNAVARVTNIQHGRHGNMISTPSLPPNPNQPYSHQNYSNYNQTSVSGSQLVPGGWVSQYQLHRKIGEGGMAEVWLAQRNGHGVNPNEPQMVALKVLFENYAKQPRTVRRFTSEIHAGMRVVHPNFAQIYGGFTHGIRPVMVMEFVQGRPLSDVIGKEVGPIEWGRSLPIFEQLLHVVGHLHQLGLIHRDIKPENIVIDHQNRIKLLDLGIAKDKTREQFTMVNQGFGTVSYMAPEQYTHARDVDHRADIYALGMTLYEMVAGRLPWEEEETDFNIQFRKSKLELPNPRKFYPEIPSWVVNAIYQALKTDPTERYNSVNEFYGALKVDQTVEIVPEWRMFDPNLTGELPVSFSPNQEASEGAEATGENLPDNEKHESTAVASAPSPVKGLIALVIIVLILMALAGA